MVWSTSITPRKTQQNPDGNGAVIVSETQRNRDGNGAVIVSETQRNRDGNGAVIARFPSQLGAKLLCLLLASLAPLLAWQPADPIAVYKSGNFNRALPLLQEAVANNPKDAGLQAALLSTFVYLGRVDEALQAAENDIQNFPQSPEVIAARGELAFYMGDMAAAEADFRSAIKIKDETAHAYYGLFRLYFAGSMYRSARLYCLRAHDIDPDDARIAAAYMGYLTPQKRDEMQAGFSQSHPWLFGHLQQMEATASDLGKEINGRKVFELDGPKQEVTVPLHYIHDGNTIVGLGIDVSINGSRPFLLTVDTGATGLLLTQKAIDEVGLTHIGSLQVGGIGDKGQRNAFISVADICTLGNIKFKTCVARATEGKQGIVQENEGLMGTDVFSDYLITIDFQRHTLHLVPLPDREPNPQRYNREPLPSEAAFTPVFRFGHHLDVLTKVNNQRTGLFLIDTGSTTSFIDATFALLTTKIRGNDYASVTGVSGSVKKVFEADKAELQFSHFLRDDPRLMSIDLNHQGHEEVRMDGILGQSLLQFFRLTLDYRNGLVDFEYVPDARANKRK